MLIAPVAFVTFFDSLNLCSTCDLSNMRSSSNPWVFYQNAALLLLAALATTWKPTTANLNSATTAAAASAHLGSALLVHPTQPLEPESGNGSFHFVLQKVVAARVSGFSTKLSPSSSEYPITQVQSLRQTTLATTLTTSRRQKRYKQSKVWPCYCNSLHLKSRTKPIAPGTT